MRFALIYWILDKKSDVIAISKIPARDRHEGGLTSLEWTDKTTNVTMKHSARVLKMGCKRSDLEKLAVDDVGCIIDPKIQKSYTKDVLDKKKELQNKKTKNKSAVNQKQNRSESLLKKASIFNSLKTQSPSELTSDAVDPLQNCTRSSDGESSSEDDKEDKENDTIANELESPPILSHEFMDGMRRIMCYFEGIHQRQNTSTNELQTNQVIKCINTASPNKVEIFEGSNYYIRKERFESILRRHGEKKDWKKIITEILVELYGNNLQFYSAKGCKGSLGVYWRLSDAIKDLIKIKLAIPITSKMFSKHINNVCCNRKLKYKGASPSTSRSSTKRSMTTSNNSNKLSKRPKKLEFFQPNHTSTPFDETISSELPGAKDFFAQSPASKSSDYSTQSPLHDHQVNSPSPSRIESPGYRPQPPPTTPSSYSTQPPSSETPVYRPQPPPTTPSNYSTQPPSSENPGYRPQPPPTTTLSYSSVPARIEHQSYFSQPLGTAAPNYSPISSSVNTIPVYCTQSPNDLPPVNWPAARGNVYWQNYSDNTPNQHPHSYQNQDESSNASNIFSTFEYL